MLIIIIFCCCCLVSVELLFSNPNFISVIIIICSETVCKNNKAAKIALFIVRLNDLFMASTKHLVSYILNFCTCGATFIKLKSRFVLLLLYLWLVFLGLENLSYKKNTWQHTTRSTGYSSRAVDGLYTDRSYSGNQCAATGDSYFALWWVDLGHVSRIDHIVMYFRTDNEPWGKKMMFAAQLFINDFCIVWTFLFNVLYVLYHLKTFIISPFKYNKYYSLIVL